MLKKLALAFFGLVLSAFAANAQGTSAPCQWSYSFVNNQATATYCGVVQATGGFAMALANGNIFVGNASNIATGVTPSGDASMTNAGVFTIGSFNGGTPFGTYAGLSAMSGDLSCNSAGICSVTKANGNAFPNSGTLNDIATMQANGMYQDSHVAISTVASLTAQDQIVSGGANLTSNNIGTITGSTTIDCGKNNGQFFTNNGSVTIVAPSIDGICYILMTNGASAVIPTFSGFNEGSNTGDPLDATNGHMFGISVTRINAISHYLVTAYQ